jgi:hypothetical protein
MEPTTEDDTAALVVATPSKREIVLAETTATVEEIARYSGVELDIPAEKVASMAIERKLSEKQIDALMLARADHDARFSVIDLLLRSGFTTDQIYAAYYVVDQSDLAFEKDLEVDTKIVGVVERPKSFGSVAEDSTTAPARIRESEGFQHLQLNRRNRFVAMVASWFATFDVFDDLSDIDEVMNLLGVVITKAQETFGWREDADLVILARLFAMLEENGIETYDDVLRFLAERSR